MTKKDLSKLSDLELLAEAKKLKSFSLTNAFFVGFLVGIVLYSVLKNNWGMLTLIPLYLLYKLINDSKKKRNKDLDELLKQRNLK